MQAEGLEVWRWLAGIFAVALTGILGILARAAVRGPPTPPETAESWSRERSGVFHRLGTLEEHVVSLRRDRHNHANDIQRVDARVELQQHDTNALREDVRENRDAIRDIKKGPG